MSNVSFVFFWLCSLEYKIIAKMKTQETRVIVAWSVSVREWIIERIVVRIAFDDAETSDISTGIRANSKVNCAYSVCIILGRVNAW